jgi:hypothetical protein
MRALICLILAHSALLAASGPPTRSCTARQIVEPANRAVWLMTFRDETGHAFTIPGQAGNLDGALADCKRWLSAKDSARFRRDRIRRLKR